MTGFSQPERHGLERMQQASLDSHPDADLLAAFAEHALTPREHQQVLGHLAVCANCREVVALAGSPLVEPVPEPVRKRALWEMALFRWGAVAATVAVVVVAVFLGTHQEPKTPTAAIMSETPPPAMVADKVVTGSSAKVAQEVASPAPVPEPEAARQASSPKPAPPATTRRAVHLQEQVRYEKVSPQELKLSTGGPAMGGPTPAPQQAVAPPMPAENSAASGDQVGYLTGSSGQAQKSLRTDIKQAAAAPRVQAKIMPSESAGLDKNNESFSAAKDATAANMAAVVPQTAQSQNAFAKSKKELARPQTMAPAVAATGTQWQINSAGQLQRAAAGQSGWQNILPDHTFRTVAAVREHIWAGGDHGLLYYSPDDGHTWKPLQVQSGDVSLTGNIIQIRFDGETHGTVETSTGETWSTNDGGGTWIKQ